MSFRGRIALLVGLAVGIAVAVMAVAAFVIARSTLRVEVDDSLRERVAEVTQPQIRERFGGGRPLPPFLPRGRNDFVVQIVNTTGPSFSFDEDVTLPIHDLDLAVAAHERGPHFRDATIDGTEYRIHTAPVGDGQAIQVARPLTEVIEVTRRLGVLLFVVGGLGVAGAVAAGLGVARGVLGPVRRLTAAAEHVAQTQELDASIEIDRDDELGRLAGSFNKMLDALASSRDQQQRLVRDASHELRTPLTVLRTNAELLERLDELPPDDQRRLRESMLAEIDELSHLTAELVELATDPSARDQQNVPLQLDELAAGAVERARLRTDTPIELDTEPTPVTGTPMLLDRAIGNLLDNAVKWSRNSQPITVSVRDGRVAVRDHGPGIPEGDRAHVFERFYRSEGAKATPGSGLGLAIVEQIVSAHGGTVFVEEPSGGGALVGFVLPSSST